MSTLAFCMRNLTFSRILSIGPWCNTSLGATFPAKAIVCVGFFKSTISLASTILVFSSRTTAFVPISAIGSIIGVAIPLIVKTVGAFIPLNISCRFGLIRFTKSFGETVSQEAESSRMAITSAPASKYILPNSMSIGLNIS